MHPQYAVMGNPINHSLSPDIHQLFATQLGLSIKYVKILIDLPRFEQQVIEFFNQGGKGLNITLPCKQRAFAMGEQITARCLKAGAANTLWMHSGQLHVDNTDGVGLLRDLQRHVDVKGKAILILGAGGAARGILHPLFEAQPERVTVANRTLEKAQALQQDFPHIHCQTLENVGKNDYDVIINATSASLGGASLVLPESLMTTNPFCYDLAYNRTGKTPFVHWASAHGCVAMDGLGMLIEQAAEAFFIWHGMLPDTVPVLNKLYLPA